MKGKHPVITLLGSNSGNNAGDAAILAASLEVLSAELPGAEFLVPTHKPQFVDRNYGSKFNVKGINFMPWTGSIRLIGISTFRALARSDVALICDGIIFDRKLFNPFFNWLINLVFLVPWCKLVGCKLVCYNTGIGPFKTKLGRKLARYLIDSCALVTMREEDSKQLCLDIGVTQPVELTADAAFANKVSDDRRAHEIAIAEGIDFSRPLLGINLTAYADTWLGEKGSNGKRDFVELIANGITAANAKLGCEFDPIVFSTHPMDESSAQRLAGLLHAPLVSNTKYLSHDLQAIMQKCQLFMGMRFHSLVLSSAVAAPIVGMVYMPKVKSYMKQLHSEDCMLELAEVSANQIAEILEYAWPIRAEIRARQQIVVKRLKQLSLKAAELVRQRFFTGQAEHINLAANL